MTEIILAATTAILSVTLLVREWQNRSERRELLDRIMCRDYQEFKRNERAGGHPSRPHVLPGRMSDEELAAESAKKTNA